MSKKNIIIGLGLLGVVLLVSFIGFSSSSDDVSISSEVTITALEGGVTLEKKSGKEISVSPTEKAVHGEIVKTDSEGSALISGEHNMYLDRDSVLVLNLIDEGKSNVTLEVGRVWSRVEKLLEQGEYFEIETENARAAVRGTSFGILRTLSTTTLLVAEGNVAFALKGSSGGVLAYTEQSIPAGKKAVAGGGTFTISDITKEDMDEWFMGHNPGWVKPTPVKSVQIETKPESQNFALPREVKVEVVPQVIEVSSPLPVSQTLAIDSVVPSEVVEGNNTVTLNGRGFTKIRSLVIGKNTISHYKILSDTKIQFNVLEVGLKAGIYDVALMDISNTFVVKEKALKVIEAPVVERSGVKSPTGN